MFLQDLDYIVIGSGMGGLWLAAALTKCGYKVMVLEQLLRREVLLTKFSITPNRFGCFGFFGSPHKILTQNLTTFHGCFNIFKRLDIFRLDYIRYQPWTLPIVSLGFQGITSQEAAAMPLIRMVWSLRQACSSVRRLDIWFVFMRWENGRYHLQSAILRRFQCFLSGSFRGWRLIFFTAQAQDMFQNFITKSMHRCHNLHASFQCGGIPSIFLSQCGIGQGSTTLEILIWRRDCWVQ